MSHHGREPIEYRYFVDIRFADLDFYGHVNSAHYLDLVATARLNFMDRVMKHSASEIAKKGIGFFLLKSTINYKKPINGLQRVLSASRVIEVRDEKIVIVSFTIEAEDGSQTFSDGLLEYGLIDMKTRKLVTAPDWLLDLVFK